MKKLIFLTFPLLFSFTTCGHRAPPKPPYSKVPQTPKVKGLVQDYTAPLLWWEKTKTFSDGRKLSEPNKVSYLILINFGKRKVKTKENYFKDLPIGLREKRCYQVVSIYSGRKSKPSEPRCIVGKEPIERVPQIEKAVAGDGFVKLLLKPYEGYQVEVFKNQKPPFTTPFTVLNGTSLFVDKDVKNGKEYTYYLRFSSGSLKGKVSPPIKLTPADRVPPLPPENPLLICCKTCLLVWEPSPSKDVVGYLIVSGKERFSVKGIYYTFSKRPKGVFIYAVDKAGNLSKPVKVEAKGEKGCSGNGK